MHIAVGVVALLSAVLIATVLSRRSGLPEPLVLTLVGVVGSYLPFVPQVELTPDFVLIGLLPPLLFAAAAGTSLVDFRSQIIPIGMLSVGLVLFTALGVALVAWWLLPIPFAVAFAVGAVVAPPDAVAATAVARNIGIPRRVVTLLEGESLVNDATAIVSLRTAILAITGTVTVAHVAVSFLVSAIGGVVIGLAVAYAVNRLLPRLKDVSTSVLLGLLSPWLAYLPAEQLEASGVLAVVVAGLLIAHKAPYRQNALTRISNRINWRTIQFVLENTVFLLVGLQVRGIIDGLVRSELGWPTILASLVGILVAVLFLRPLWMFVLQALTHRGSNHLGWKDIAVASWAGMRGVVTLAAALILPAQTPHREVLVAAALVVVGGTLLLQGATLPWLARRLKVQGPDPRQDTLQEAQILQVASRAGREYLETMRKDPEHNLDDALAAELRSRSERRVNAVWEALRTDAGEGEPPSETYRRARLTMLRTEREEVLRIRDEGAADHQVLQRVMTALDIEESMLDSVEERSRQLHDAEIHTPRMISEACGHLDEALSRPDPDPQSWQCLDCLAEGTIPVHLRMCMTCGHVGCCDSSVGLHSTRHHQETQHPVMRSFESGERWCWCYVDELLD